MIPTWVFTNSFILNIIWFNVRSTQSGCRIEHLRDYLLRLFCKQLGCSASTSHFCCFYYAAPRKYTPRRAFRTVRNPFPHIEFHILTFTQQVESGNLEAPGCKLHWGHRMALMRHYESQRGSWMGCNCDLEQRREGSSAQKSWERIETKVLCRLFLIDIT